MATTTVAQLVCTSLSLRFLALTCARHQGVAFWFYATGEDAKAVPLIEVGIGLLALYWSAIAPLGQVLHLLTVQPLKINSTADMDTVSLSSNNL